MPVVGLVVLVVVEHVPVPLLLHLQRAAHHFERGERGHVELVVADSLMQDATALLVLHHSWIRVGQPEGGLEQGVPSERGATVLADEAANPEACPRP
eukprot:8995525-Pyramimonas_sp.AAC.1